VKSAYVYYRIDPARINLAKAHIDTLLNAMARHCSQPPRRLERCDDPATWMEIYEGIADFPAFATALDQAALACGCAGFTQGERHLECFFATLTAP
jgi:hypothetical protein